MKNKKFIIICCVLIVITTISLVITSLLKEKPDKSIQFDDLKNKTFKHEISDSMNTSSEEIIFEDNKGKKMITIKSNRDDINDINEEVNFTYTINDKTIYVYYNDLTYAYRMKNNCIYDVNNTDVKYCIEKDA